MAERIRVVAGEANRNRSRGGCTLVQEPVPRMYPSEAQRRKAPYSASASGALGAARTSSIRQDKTV